MTWGKTAVFIACVCGTICFVGILGFHSLQTQLQQLIASNSVALPKTVQVATASNSANRVAISPPRLSVSTSSVVRSSTSSSALSTRAKLLEQGRNYGTNAEWKKGFECFKQCVDAGPLPENDWQLASAIALAAGETNACEEFCAQYMKAFGKSTSADCAERIAKECFSMPHCPEALFEQAIERADFAISKGRSTFRNLAKGMGEYRRQNWSGALEWLNQVETSNSLEGSAVAWAFGAMARHQLGDTQGARQALEQVNRRIGVVIRTGQLGWWQEIARAVVARDEAERLILGKITSPPLNPSEILENRTKWQAFTFSLNAGNTMASQSQWIPAAEYYAKALQDPVFDWSSSELKEDYLPMQSAAVFLMAEDRTNFCALVRGLAARKMENLSPIVQEHYGQIFVMNPDILTPELKQQALAYARRVCDNPERANSFWIRLLRGETEYRQGNFETAVDMLGPLIFSSTETIGAARGKVFLAMALKRLGKSKESLEAMQEANGLFIKAMGQGADRVNQIYYQTVMNELLAMVASTPGAAPQK